jgi:hypothetical protein
VIQSEIWCLATDTTCKYCHSLSHSALLQLLSWHQLSTDQNTMDKSHWNWKRRHYMKCEWNHRMNFVRKTTILWPTAKSLAGIQWGNKERSAWYTESYIKRTVRCQGSTSGPETSWTDRFLCFFHSMKADAKVESQVRTRMLPSKFFWIHYSLIILPFNTM